MSKPKFSLVTAILLLLLIAAVMNLFFVNRAYNNAVDTMAPPPLSPAATSTPQLGDDDHRSALHGVTQADLVPSWHGEATLVRAPGGGYDLVVEALSNGVDARMPATAAEADIRHPGDAAALQSPTLTLSTVGKFTAHVELSSGTWEVRVHIHRGFQTLEFAKRFDLTD